MPPFEVSFEMILPLETLMTIRASKNVAEQVPVFLIVLLHMPLQILRGNKSLLTLLAAMNTFFMPTLVMTEATLAFVPQRGDIRQHLRKLVLLVEDLATSLTFQRRHSRS